MCPPDQADEPERYVAPLLQRVLAAPVAEDLKKDLKLYMAVTVDAQMM